MFTQSPTPSADTALSKRNKKKPLMTRGFEKVYHLFALEEQAKDIIKVGVYHQAK